MSDTLLEAVLEAAGGWGAEQVGVVVSDAQHERASYGDLSTALPVASVTKLFSAWAILVAVEEGTLRLDDPAGPPGATVAHLLSHASGLAPDSSDVLAVPATKRIYSNAGFDVLAEVLSERSGMAAPDYVSDAVLLPLGLTATFSGHSLAHGLACSVTDLARFGREVLRPTLISQATVDAALSPQWIDLAGVLPGFGRQDPNWWGLGFELRGTKAPHWMGERVPETAAGHFGRGGSFLLVDRFSDLVAATVTDLAFDEWAVEAWPPFVDAIVGSWV